jgi:hypothetical protein
MRLVRTLFSLLFAWALAQCAFAGSILPSGTSLYPGQAVYSPSQTYYAVMQGDGNFVMYRARDLAVRFATSQFGSYVAMQTDGNLVEYNSTPTALWNTRTYGYPGAYMAVQDDGNMVVYSTGGAPLWNIGADTSLLAPSNVGDVPARDLNYPGLSIVGHIGMWTGSQVAEAVSGQSNAVRYVSWQTFSTTSNVWGTAKPNVPSFYIYYCFDSFCEYFTGSNYPPAVQARMALASRAHQIYLIGSDYTLLGVYTIATPSYPGQPAQRGQYRCDTFVVDVFQSSAGWNLNKPVPAAWQSRMDNLASMPKTPQSVWNALKN